MCAFFPPAVKYPTEGAFPPDLCCLALTRCMTIFWFHCYKIRPFLSQSLSSYKVNFSKLSQSLLLIRIQKGFCFKTMLATNEFNLKKCNVLHFDSIFIYPAFLSLAFLLSLNR